MSASAFEAPVVAAQLEVTETVAVEPGAHIAVAPGDAVGWGGRLARSPKQGETAFLDVAAGLQVASRDVARWMTVGPGDLVQPGQEVARRDTWWGGRRTVRCPWEGTVTGVSSITGHLAVRRAPQWVEIRTPYAGRVVSLEPRGIAVRGRVSVLSGVVGFGREATGVLHPVDGARPGAVCWGDAPLTPGDLRALRDAGAVAVVAPCIDAAAWRSVCGDGVDASATGEVDVGITAVFTEGIGRWTANPCAVALLRALEGETVTVRGVTQVRAGAVRPRLVGPVVSESLLGAHASEERSVLVLAGAHRGKRGIRCTDRPQVVTTPHGVRTPCHQVALGDVREWIPAANLQPLGLWKGRSV